MANTNANALSGGATAGGIFNLSDADLIALIVKGGPMATDVSRILVSEGTVTVTSGETWGVIVG